MKKSIRKPAFVILAAVFVCGLVLVLTQLSQYGSAQDSYDLAAQIAYGGTVPTTLPTQPETLPEAASDPTQPPEATLPAQPTVPMDAAARFLQQVDVFSLRQVNNEVLGWIYIPDTVISYPLMCTTERDKYLKLAWDGTPNGSGSIFLEKSNQRDFSDFNTIIYGHHITNGTMFQPLMNYKDAEFFDGHPYIYITTGSKIYRYRVFAAYEAPVESDTYRLYFADDGAKLAAIEYYLQGRTDLALTPEDHILTLSTCTGTGVYTTRWVVQGVLDAQWQK